MHAEELVPRLLRAIQLGLHPADFRVDVLLRGGLLRAGQVLQDQLSFDQFRENDCPQSIGNRAGSDLAMRGGNKQPVDLRR